jgi:aminoglycoside phosphotransferase (APT) family kinase protein
LNPYEIQRLLEQAGIAGSVRKVTNIATGLLNEVYQTELDNGKQLIIRKRIFQHQEYGQQFASERYVYEFIKGKKIYKPHLYHVCNDTTSNPFPVAVFEYISGPTADKIFGDSTSDKTHCFQLLDQLAYALSEIHSVTGTGYGSIMDINFPPDQTDKFLSHLFSKETERLCKVDASLAKAYDKAQQKWVMYICSLPPELTRSCVVHGDIHGRNLIAHKIDQLFLIDWEASRYRMALFDFGQFRFLNLKDDQKMWEHFAKAYLTYRGINFSVSDFSEVTAILETFWKCRMSLFQSSFPGFEDHYFGYSCDHLASVKSFVCK